MQRNDIERIFEAFFDKYKKTEGDRTAWSAVWTDMTPEGVLELNMTKCPKGTTFKIFVNKRKVAQVIGWDAYFETMKTVVSNNPGLYNPDRIFADMEFML